MKNIKKNYIINASIEKVWDALINPSTIEKWGGGPVKMDDHVGTKFSLWGGEIWGKNLEVKKENKLVQEWWSKGELSEKPSTVTFSLIKKGEKTELKFIQTEVPEQYEKQLDHGWDDFYLGAMKELLES